MPTIGIVDDRDDVREIMWDNVRLALPNEWEVIAISPWESLEHYPSWVNQHEITVLVIDEKLNELLTNAGTAVSYEGHDLVDYMRQYMPEFPIFVVTSYPNDPDLQERFKYVEDIIERNKFYDRSEDYIPRLTRAGQRYLQVYEGELAELADFARKSAIGEPISVEEQERARAIQTKLVSTFPIENITSRSEWLSQMEQLIEKLELLKNDIEHQTGGQS